MNDSFNKTIGMLEEVRGLMLAMKINPEDLPIVLRQVQKMIKFSESANEEKFFASWLTIMNLRNYIIKKH